MLAELVDLMDDLLEGGRLEFIVEWWESRERKGRAMDGIDRKMIRNGFERL